MHAGTRLCHRHTAHVIHHRCLAYSVVGVYRTLHIDANPRKYDPAQASVAIPSPGQ